MGKVIPKRRKVKALSQDDLKQARERERERDG